MTMTMMMMMITITAGRWHSRLVSAGFLSKTRETEKLPKKPALPKRGFPIHYRRWAVFCPKCDSHITVRGSVDTDFCFHSTITGSILEMCDSHKVEVAALRESGCGITIGPENGNYHDEVV